MDNWEIYNYLKAKNGGSSEDSDTLDALIDRSITEISNDRVTSIGNYAFHNCSKLTIADFPNATSISSNVFQSCSSLTTVDFPNVTSIGADAFQNCSSLTTVDFPSATSIGMNAFNACYNLTTVDFPNVTSIEREAFQSCSKLATVILRKNQVATLFNTNAFNSTPITSGTGYIYVPDDLVESYKTANNWKTFANQIKGLSELPE